MKKLNLFMQVAMFVSLVSVNSNMLYGETVFTAEDGSIIGSSLLGIKPNENGEYVLEDGCYYRGGVKDGMMHGEGEINCPVFGYRVIANLTKGRVDEGRIEITFLSGNKFSRALEKGIPQKERGEFIPKNGVPCKCEFDANDIDENKEFELHCIDRDVVYKERLLSPESSIEPNDENL